MSKTVTATEAKNRLGALLAEAQEAPVIVEIRGAPKAAIISIEDLRRFEKLQVSEERRQRLERLERLHERLAARNADLSFEQATELVERFSQDIFESMAERGTVHFEE